MHLVRQLAGDGVRRMFIGENTFIFEANVVQPGVTVGDNVVLWSGNHIGHDSVIEDHCFIASHAVHIWQLPDGSPHIQSR